MNILLTGSSGFIGSKLTPFLQDRGHHIVGIDRRIPEYSHPDMFIQGDLLDRRVVLSALEGVHMVMHLAAAKDDWGLTKEEYFQDNVDATRNLIAQGRRAGVTRWLHYSTVGVLPRTQEPLDESTPVHPDTSYGESKVAAERLFEDLCTGDRAAEVILLRPSVVFGPENPPSTNIYRLIESIHKGRFVMVGNGKVVKSTSYIVNLLAATVFLMDRFKQGIQLFHYVDEPELTTERLVDHIYESLGKSRPVWRLSQTPAALLARVFDLAASGTGIDLPITSARISKFCTPTNFSAKKIRDCGFKQEVGFEEAILATVRWHLSDRSR